MIKQLSPEIDIVGTAAGEICATPGWARVSKAFSECEYVLLLGHGGNLAIAQHAASDISRLTGKAAFAPDNPPLTTAVITEKNVAAYLINWISLQLRARDPGKGLVLGFSCSADTPSSESIVAACEYAQSSGIPATLLSGTKKKSISPGVNLLVSNTNYYHSSELVFISLFYQLIYEFCGSLPSLKKASSTPDVSGGDQITKTA